MTREISAEEIEEFLEHLDAVSSVRIVSNAEGHIEHIYVTSETERDDGLIRRAITSALMTRYGLHTDGWRIHIAHLAPGTVALPRFRLFRMEETLSDAATKVTIELRFERDGGQKSTVGRATAPPGGAFRLRAIAEATLDAMEPALDALGWRLALESVGIVSFAGAQVALVAVAVTMTPGETAPDIWVGAEVVRSSETEALVRATVGAVRAPVEETSTPAPRGRWARIQAMRAHYHRMVRVGPPQDAVAAPQSIAEPQIAEDSEARTEATSAGSQTAGEAAGVQTNGQAEEESTEESGREPVSTVSNQDVTTLEEIRPEGPLAQQAAGPSGGEGGLSMGRGEERSEIARRDTYREGFRPEAARGVSRGSFEDEFYRRLVEEGTRAHIRCRDGYEIHDAVLKDFGTYSLLIMADGVEELLFKHGIISIRPQATLPRDLQVQA